MVGIPTTCGSRKLRYTCGSRSTSARHSCPTTLSTAPPRRCSPPGLARPSARLCARPSWVYRGPIFGRDSVDMTPRFSAILQCILPVPSVGLDGEDMDTGDYIYFEPAHAVPASIHKPDGRVIAVPRGKLMSVINFDRVIPLEPSFGLSADALPPLSRASGDAASPSRRGLRLIQ